MSCQVPVCLWVFVQLGVGEMSRAAASAIIRGLLRSGPQSRRFWKCRLCVSLGSSALIPAHRQSPPPPPPKGSEEPGFGYSHIDRKSGIITGLNLVTRLAGLLPVLFRSQQKPACMSPGFVWFCFERLLFQGDAFK